MSLNPWNGIEAVCEPSIITVGLGEFKWRLGHLSITEIDNGCATPDGRKGLIQRTYGLKAYYTKLVVRTTLANVT